MKYHLDWLIERFSKEEKIKYLFFWGHTPSKDGTVSASCFSQWWAFAPFEVDSVSYKTAEHWMMCGKARLFGDTEVLEKILGSNTPAEAKKLGREVRDFDPIVWDRQKYDLVKQGNLHKFGKHEALKAFLKDTQERVLVEASPYDAVWGIGMAASDPNIENPTLWKGQNLLGFALMEVRDNL